VPSSLSELYDFSDAGKKVFPEFIQIGIFFVSADKFTLDKQIIVRKANIVFLVFIFLVHLVLRNCSINFFMKYFIIIPF
jgi:hypothetical protein